MITRKTLLIKLVGDTLLLILDGIDNLKHRKAPDKLAASSTHSESSSADGKMSSCPST